MSEDQYPVNRADAWEIRDQLSDVVRKLEDLPSELLGGQYGEDFTSYLREELHGIGRNSNALVALPGIGRLLGWICLLLLLNSAFLGAILYRLW